MFYLKSTDAKTNLWLQQINNGKHVNECSASERRFRVVVHDDGRHEQRGCSL